MKRKIFIGSSKEGLEIANHVSDIISRACGDWLEVILWTDGGVFQMNKSTLDSLISVSRRFDYGLLIATRDDRATIRRQKFWIPRDNVMFEMGMFLGSLGLTRAFLFVENSNKLPTDYNGITVGYFNRKDKKSIEVECSKLIKQLENTKNTFNLKPLPSASLALGYYENFLLPAGKKILEDTKDFQIKVAIPKDLKNIRSEIIQYRRENKSTEISVYENGTRPLIHKLENEIHHYWDIPTTLGTLQQLIDVILHSDEVGISKEKREWIEHELRNFTGTLEMLADNGIMKGKVKIEWI